MSIPSAISPIPGLAALSSLVGLVVGVLVLVILLATVGAFVVIVVANRAEADPSGRRPAVVYLFGASFVTVWTALIGSAAAVSSLFQLIGSHPGMGGGSLHPVGDAVARGAVLGGLVLAVSLAVLVTHLRRGVTIATAPAATRVAQSYVSAVSFVSVLIVAFSLAYIAYAICQIAGPGVFHGDGRIPTLRHLLDAIWVALAAGAILGSHLRLARPRVWSGGAPAASA
ncbi:MAG TPA: hypothetical protein VKV23_09265 [Acidimicrobiales bacterium]|nr:hypothetical protein [Acidimicrobiales bacterium]